MKRLFYFILLIAGFSSIHSCKDLTDEEGNPLLDLNENTGLIGPRALSREVTNVGMIAQYQYTGLLLTKVITEKASITDVEWSGDKISRLTFNGFLDLDNDGTIDSDSVSYTQQYTYGNLSKLTMISENRTVFRRTPPPVGSPPGTPSGPYVVFAKTKSMYNLTYSSTTSKLASIVMKRGEDITSFAYTDYTKAVYSYLGDNVSSVAKEVGKLTGGTVFEDPDKKFVFNFSSYDSQISGYTLLPFEYKVSVLISTDINDDRGLILSPNSPKRASATDMIPAIPVTVVVSTNYKYDPQTYMTQGFGINYFYKPL
ncbi:hypothetical protein [Chryseobacterium balustinum]|uniref:DUF4270 family protein n=1 Tax=Chryseobacterium balustinum TaxID=246 RepID=A0AAX2IGT2_9FLAO|nr:hypothetical protein [Chryseobacterium balustinum]AZB31097.1 hypothetical protein EB354_18545 [Chryseobacterium balustinum]SKB40314.1 hypothetical protein SAMN05421800_101454 [Chryseobacterium balustinum]SQA87814.1 Uncharacterised protein [Chryseobacterium balustinum]